MPDQQDGLLSLRLPKTLLNVFSRVCKELELTQTDVVFTLLAAFVQEPGLFRVRSAVYEHGHWKQKYYDDAVNREKLWELLSSCYMIEVSSHEKLGHTITLVPVGYSTTARSARRKRKGSDLASTHKVTTSTVGPAVLSRSEMPSGPYSPSPEEMRTPSVKVLNDRKRRAEAREAKLRANSKSPKG